jgi:hypothetical protein
MDRFWRTGKKIGANKKIEFGDHSKCNYPMKGFEMRFMMMWRKHSIEF